MTTQQAPRTGDVALGGLPWLARMLDKARLDAQGTIADFDLVYPCPMDQRLLKQLNLDPKVFQQMAVTHHSDEAVLTAMAEAGAQLP
jgi:hypothetical protein